MKFIEHHQVFEFIEIYKFYLDDKNHKNFTMSYDNLGGKTFLHLALEHSST
jgi:hypothetical protein